MDNLLFNLNNSKIFTGLAMITMNIGGRYLHLDFPKSLDYLFKNQLLRSLVVFCVVFISIHDIKLSILLTLIYLLIIKVLLNENSRACILPKKHFDFNNDGNITSEEVIKAKEILNKYRNSKNNNK